MFSAIKPECGPGYYMLPSTVGTSSPAFSFGSRPGTISFKKAPGPQSYNISDLTRFGRNTVPSCVLGGRLQHGGWYPKEKCSSPGPGAYNPDLYGSIQWKCAASRMLFKDNIPRSQHSLMNEKSSTPKKGCWAGTPGPGTYDATPLDFYKTRQPRVKMPPYQPQVE